MSNCKVPPLAGLSLFKQLSTKNSRAVTVAQLLLLYVLPKSRVKQEYLFQHLGFAP